MGAAPGCAKSPVLKGTNQTSMEVISEKAVLSKITWRLIPFLFLLYIVAYLDRSNASFLRVEQHDHPWLFPWLNDAVYGLGFGIFFIGYFLFEVPSNLMLQRVGARIWIARIMVTWGLVAMGMMFVNSAPMFYGMRFLLGVAEAGFFPGIILYLTYWYTAKDRARMVALFMTATAIANASGNSISGALLSMKLAGLANWQWMFILEGLPAVLLAFVVLAYLPDGPKKARWLTDEEKIWTTARIEAEDRTKEQRGHASLLAGFTTPGVLPLCLLYVTIAMATYGIGSWMPDLLSRTMVKHTPKWEIGLLTAIPYVFAAVVMVLNGRHSDRTGERRVHVAVPMFVTAAGLALSAYQHSAFGVVATMTIACVGIFSPLGPFWALPTALLGGAAAAAGIAFINSVGNLGGFLGPYSIGKIPDFFPKGSPLGMQYSLLMLAGVAALGGITVLVAAREPTVSPPQTET
jgi:MFS transporter, ACS family, tartrate transporter